MAIRLVMDCKLSVEGERFLAHCRKADLMSSGDTAKEAADRLCSLIMAHASVSKRVQDGSGNPTPNTDSKRFTITLRAEVSSDLK